MTHVMIHTRNYMTSVMMIQGRGDGSLDESGVRVFRPDSSDAEAVLAMLRRCSRSSLFHRFHGFTDGANYFGALLQGGPFNRVFAAWCGSQCVGIANLGTEAMGIVDLGVLVEDAWQRRGIGTWLVASLLVDARAHGVTTVHADVLGDDLFIVDALRRIGPLSVSIEFGSYSIDFEILRQAGRRSGPGLSAGVPTEDGRDSRWDWQWAEDSFGGTKFGPDGQPGKVVHERRMLDPDA
jgi:GNAT superfamily N-acetyltransferase